MIRAICPRPLGVCCCRYVLLLGISDVCAVVVRGRVSGVDSEIGGIGMDCRPFA